MGAIVAVMFLGYIVVPALSGLVVPVSILLLAATAICLVFLVVRLFQFLIARQGFYRAVSSDLGDSYASQLQERENPHWWTRMTTLQRVAYLVAVLVVGLILAMLRPALGGQNFLLRAIIFIAVIGVITIFGMRLLRR